MTFAIITRTSHTIPGDERSRTNPGHGYPEHTVDSIEMTEFPTRDALIKRLEMHLKVNPRYLDNRRIIEFTDLQINSHITVEIKTPDTPPIDMREAGLHRL